MCNVRGCRVACCCLLGKLTDPNGRSRVPVIMLIASIMQYQLRILARAGWSLFPRRCGGENNGVQIDVSFFRC